MNIDKPARKYAIAVECLIDFDEAQEELKDRFYGDADRQDIPYDAWSRTFFAQLAPRKGMLGFILDMKREYNAGFLFFTATQDSVQGERAENWLREWLADPFIVLAQNPAPANLDAQVLFLPEGSTDYRMSSDRPRVVRLPPSGVFKPMDFAWAIDLESDGYPPEDSSVIEPPEEAPALTSDDLGEEDGTGPGAEDGGDDDAADDEEV